MAVGRRAVGTTDHPAGGGRDEKEARRLELVVANEESGRPRPVGQRWSRHDDNNNIISSNNTLKHNSLREA